MVASQPAAERHAEQHRAAQAALALAAGRAIRAAWEQVFNLGDLTRTADLLTPSVEAVSRNYGRAGATAALTDYRNQRRAAGVSGRPSLKMPTPVSREDATLSVQHVLTPLYGNPTPEQVTAAEESLESSVERLVLDQSRSAVINAVRSDREARGWARVTEPEACYFCAMLAARGAVYRTKQAANFRAHTKQPNGSGGTCRCHVEAFFNEYEPTAQARQWQADWERLKAENGGHLSLIQWRRAYEGRDGTDRAPLG